MIGDKKGVEFKISLALLVILIQFVMLIRITSAADPTGASFPAPTRSERMVPDAPTGVDAIAGNVTEINIYGYSITQSWQGYFGNVSGSITLEDAYNNTFYNWSLASPEGEVYAANNTVTWANIQCFNLYSVGLGDPTCDIAADVTASRGAMSQCGMNNTELEELYGIQWDDVDGVNETFGSTITHDVFYTGSLEFSAGECYATAIFDNTGQSVDNHFEEVLLWDPNGNTTVFTAVLDEESPLGFDNTPKDFEMMVLENGHGTDTATETYYFYVELE